MMKNRRTLTDARNTIASRPRKWRKPVPCPICGNKDIMFRKLGLDIDLLTLHVQRRWAAYCADHCCPVFCDEHCFGTWIYTPHADLKEAIRVWNRRASNYPKAKENTK